MIAIMESKMKFRVVWNPQVGSGCGTFEVPVKDREEGLKVADVLAYYDLWQFEHNIKGDYANMGGVVYWAKPISENDDDWFDCPEDDEEWQDILDEISEYEEQVKQGEVK